MGLTFTPITTTGTTFRRPIIRRPTRRTIRQLLYRPRRIRRHHRHRPQVTISRVRHTIINTTVTRFLRRRIKIQNRNTVNRMRHLSPTTRLFINRGRRHLTPQPNNRPTTLTYPRTSSHTYLLRYPQSPNPPPTTTDHPFPVPPDGETILLAFRRSVIASYPRDTALYHISNKTTWRSREKSKKPQRNERL